MSVLFIILFTRSVHALLTKTSAVHRKAGVSSASLKANADKMVVLRHVLFLRGVAQQRFSYKRVERVFVCARRELGRAGEQLIKISPAGALRGRGVRERTRHVASVQVPRECRRVTGHPQRRSGGWP